MALWPSGMDSKKSKRKNQLLLAATFGVPAVVVIGLLFLLISFRGGIEAGVANLALLLPLGWAFAAGMVASVNPCGILMLPTYVFHQLGKDEASSSAASRALRALLIAAVVTLGFIVIFGITGSLIAAGGQPLVAAFPFAGLSIGAGMMGLGIWLLVTHKTLGFLAARRVTVTPKRNLGNAFLFGIAYAVGSLSCTLPIFLGVVGSALAGGSPVFALWQFLSYALGMGAIIFLAMIGAALFRRATDKWLQLMTRHVHTLSAMFLIAAGAYLIYYWVFQAGLGW
jgi:cytochrome c biogenesis protein CcdA